MNWWNVSELLGQSRMYFNEVYIETEILQIKHFASKVVKLLKRKVGYR